jgi:hypothetical protein
LGGKKYLKFFDVDPGSGMEKLGYGINIPDPQHCQKTFVSYKPIKIRHAKYADFVLFDPKNLIYLPSATW